LAWLPSQFARQARKQFLRQAAAWLFDVPPRDPRKKRYHRQDHGEENCRTRTRTDPIECRVTDLLVQEIKRISQTADRNDDPGRQRNALNPSDPDDNNDVYKADRGNDPAIECGSRETAKSSKVVNRLKNSGRN
jgi:hypothetical protein